MMRNDRPVLDFLDGEYTFVNRALARHYGMHVNVKGQRRGCAWIDAHATGAAGSCRWPCS